MDGSSDPTPPIPAIATRLSTIKCLYIVVRISSRPTKPLSRSNGSVEIECCVLAWPARKQLLVPITQRNS